MSRIPIIFDCDPGHDDVIAMMLALAHQDVLDIRGICCATGNAVLANTVENALRMCEVYDIDIPVVAGVPTPFKEENRPALMFHGYSGMDGPILPFAKKKPLDINVCDFYKQVIDECGEIIIVAVGPLTNVAIFLLAYPEYKSKIKQIAIMGGAAVGGNQSTTAEFNIWHDPEAAHIVFKSGVPIFMAGLDITIPAGLTEEDLEELKKMGTKGAMYIYDAMQYYKVWRTRKNIRVFSMHDSVPIAWLVKPEIFETKECYVEVDLYGEYTKGCTVTDYLGLTGKEPNTIVGFKLDNDEFRKMLLDAARKLK